MHQASFTVSQPLCCVLCSHLTTFPLRLNGRMVTLARPATCGLGSSLHTMALHRPSALINDTHLSRLSDRFFRGTFTGAHMKELRRAWEADPSVEEPWDNFVQSCVVQASLSAGTTVQEGMRMQLQLLLLVRAYQANKQKYPNLDDPLGFDDVPEDIDLGDYGFTEEDLQKEFFLSSWMMSVVVSENRSILTLREIVRKLQQSHCSPIVYEYKHISDGNKRDWLMERMDIGKPKAYDKARRLIMHDRLVWSTDFENFLATEFPGTKRFGIEGGETLIPGILEMFDMAADLGVESIVMGTAHRARLNVTSVIRRASRVACLIFHLMVSLRGSCFDQIVKVCGHL